MGSSSLSNVALLSFLLVCVFFLELPWTPALSTKPYSWNLYSQSLALVKPAPLLLPYHNGPVLSGSGAGIEVHILWYGRFEPSQESILVDFLDSFAPIPPNSSSNDSAHTVSAWWSTTSGYKDAWGGSVMPALRIASQSHDAGESLGKTLTPASVEKLLFSGSRPGSGSGELSSKSIHILFTAQDVYVDGFCLNSCGYHAYTFPSDATRDKMVPYLWVGNSAVQCPGQCAWPFAAAHYGPQTPPLRPPNGDVGSDGMVINLATLLAGAATNPFGTGYYQGDASAPLEAVSACTGIFGRGAYPGYPGELLKHAPSDSSFNAHGVRGRRFLIPAMWNPSSLDCVPL